MKFYELEGNNGSLVKIIECFHDYAVVEYVATDLLSVDFVLPETARIYVDRFSDSLRPVQKEEFPLYVSKKWKSEEFLRFFKGKEKLK